jgi:hypothetical protein
MDSVSAGWQYYNGLENVFYIKNNISVNNPNDLPDYNDGKNKTYIVEGTLEINTNINSHSENL